VADQVRRVTAVTFLLVAVGVGAKCLLCPPFSAHVALLLGHAPLREGEPQVLPSCLALSGASSDRRSRHLGLEHLARRDPIFGSVSRMPGLVAGSTGPSRFGESGQG
jgi:hypothetical protein